MSKMSTCWRVVPPSSCEFCDSLEMAWPDRWGLSLNPCGSTGPQGVPIQMQTEVAEDGVF